MIIRQPFLHRNHKRLITIDESEFIAHGRNLLTGKFKNLFYQICAGEVRQTPSDHAGIASTGQGFVQGVVPLNLHWFIVGRYEFFEQLQDKAGQVGLLGLAYKPLPPIVLKLDYQLGVHNETLAPDGLSASFAILF